MNRFTRPISITSSIAFTTLSMMVVLLFLLFCQKHYLDDLPSSFANTNPAQLDGMDGLAGCSFFFFSMPGPTTFRNQQDDAPNDESCPTHHCSPTDVMQRQPLFERFLRSMLR